MRYDDNSNGSDVIVKLMWGIAITALVCTILYVLISDGIDSLFCFFHIF